MIRNILTIDVEDYYHGVQYDHYDEWHRFEKNGRVADNTRHLLRLCRRHGCHATFFILGRIAELEPELIRQIDRQGHELASHGWTHRRLGRLTPDSFRAELMRTDDALSRALGRPFRSRGYRAPYFTLGPKENWALAVMREHGMEYDSSVFPIFNYLGGDFRAPRFPYRREGIIEIPISTLRCCGINLPFSGGFYLRIAPAWFIRYGFDRLNRQGRAVVAFLHPREIDPKQPRLPMPWWQKPILYWNLRGTTKKLTGLLDNYPFGSIAETIL